jgi:uncharacterized membrane protein YeaQ/YmgE (transglycosylase-associated protein family)
VTQLEFSQAAQQWVNVVLIWLGFGIVAGLLARALVPGRHPVGAVTTLVIGVAGSAVGLLGLGYVLGGRPINPISPVGLLAAAAGAFVILVFYRLVTACLAFRAKDSQPVEAAEPTESPDVGRFY